MRSVGIVGGKQLLPTRIAFAFIVGEIDIIILRNFAFAFATPHCFANITHERGEKGSQEIVAGGDRRKNRDSDEECEEGKCRSGSHGRMSSSAVGIWEERG